MQDAEHQPQQLTSAKSAAVHASRWHLYSITLLDLTLDLEIDSVRQILDECSGIFEGLLQALTSVGGACSDEFGCLLVVFTRFSQLGHCL